MKVAPLTTPSVAPSYPLSLADRAAHEQASYVRVSAADALAAGWFPVAADPGDSDPDMDEALRRATTEVTYLQLAQDIAEQVEAAYAEYDDEPRAEYLNWADAA